MSDYEPSECECDDCAVITRGRYCRRCKPEEARETFGDSLEHALEHAGERVIDDV